MCDVRARCFRLQDTLFEDCPDGFIHESSDPAKNGGISDLSRVEAQMWFYYRATRYIDAPDVKEKKKRSVGVRNVHQRIKMICGEQYGIRIRSEVYRGRSLSCFPATRSLSPNYFSSLFKKEKQQSTVNYLIELRIRKAGEYLEHTEMSVADIARTVGYEDSQYFFRVFKKATGQTPLQYRQQHRKQE